MNPSSLAQAINYLALIISDESDGSLIIHGTNIIKVFLLASIHGRCLHLLNIEFFEICHTAIEVEELVWPVPKPIALDLVHPDIDGTLRAAEISAIHCRAVAKLQRLRANLIDQCISFIRKYYYDLSDIGLMSTDDNVQRGIDQVINHLWSKDEFPARTFIFSTFGDFLVHTLQQPDFPLPAADP